MSLKIGVLTSTTRPGRLSRQVAEWFLNEVKNEKDIEFTLVDIADFDLPLFDEPIPPAAGQYQNEHTKKWAKEIDQYDGYVFVTSEYNHAYSAALKNALDYLYKEWNKKPVAFVGYGVNGGVRAVEQLRLAIINMELVPLNAQVSINAPWEAFDENGGIEKKYYQGEPSIIAENLRWWGNVLKSARG